MRTIIFFSLACLFASSGLSQQAPMSIPCSEAWFQTLDPSDYDNQCILHIHDSQVSGTTPSEPTVIAATDQINVVNSDFLPGTDGVDLLVTSSRNTLELAWYEPQNTFIVPEYDKLELGVKLPTDVQTEVDAFIANGTGGFNPFNPEEVDVVAVFEKETSPTSWEFMKRVYGFYYEDFEMNYNLPGYTGTSEADWDWVKQTNEHSFRVRYAPPEAGRYRCKIVLTTPLDTYESIHIEFDVEPSNDPGYIRVAGNNKYLEYPNGELFFPMSANFNATGDFLDKSLDYTPYAPHAWSSKTLTPKGFDDLHDQVTEWHTAGGEMVRTLSLPWAFEIEYEKINDYSDRMTHAWEFDKYIEHLKSLDLKLQWDMMAHYPLEIDGPYNYCNWDWYDDNSSAPCGANGLCPCNSPVYETDPMTGNILFDANREPIVLEVNGVAVVESWSLTNKGFCYHVDLGLDQPKEFFTDQDAKNYFKRKLRYLISRYGYSTSVSIMELMSEINGTGVYYDPSYNNGEGGGVSPWDWDSEYRVAVAQWQYEMAQYIKEGLGHEEHLLGSSYLTDSFLEENVFNWLGDFTYTDNPYLDINLESHYKAIVGDHHSMAKAIQQKNNANKPFAYSEVGFANMSKYVSGDIKECIRPTNNTIRLLTTAFTGSAIPSNLWDDQQHESNSHWDYLDGIRQFIGGVDLNHSDWVPHGEISNDNSRSISYLKSGIQQQDNVRIIGAVLNHRYNEYTNRFCPNILDCPCNGLSSPIVEDVFFLDSDNVNDDIANELLFHSPFPAEQLRISNLGVLKNYNIRFFDPFVGDYYNDGNHEEQLTSVLGEFSIEHPPMSMENPILFFEIWRSGVPSIRNNSMNDFLTSQTPNSQEPISTDMTSTKKKDVHFRSYPNPFQEFMLIEKLGGETDVFIKIFDSQGRMVSQMVMREERIRINTEQFTPGVYIVKLFGDNSLFTEVLCKIK